MAKRSRGHTRPGQRRPLDRPARPAAPSRDRRPSDATEPTPRAAVGLSPEEEARAAELERRFLEQERPAAPAPMRPGSRAAALPRVGPRLLDPSEEYAYVARDLRRIVIVQASLVGVLVGLWILIEGLHVVRI